MEDSMGKTHRYYVWFFESKRWVEATPEGARVNWLNLGRDVSWGLMPPRREGADGVELMPLLRGAMWIDFQNRVGLEPVARYRVSSSNS
jgi:hypothetical protein